MNIKRTAVAIMLGASVGGALATAGSQPIQAATTTTTTTKKKAYRNYKSIPKVLRGTWRHNYKVGKKKASVTYKFNKTSYSETMRVKGKKTKTVKFPKNDIREIGYSYSIKQYYIIPKVTKKNSAYAGWVGLNPTKRHGKKALINYSVADNSKTYYYKVKK
ncbi:hypothetical protein [Lactiplantibacillus carotarum]|uniref:hypothetical protein n=1 Tax=Lactiplantibacillus carotarum TaxID=2993456 RepID=UPI00298F1D7B|nr:hypothetical protein [Lactiplantibacillus carotarum]